MNEPTGIPVASADGGRSLPSRRVGLALLAIVIVPATALGWRHFWFLTDDAFIAFRYASNAMLGRGLVWNPAPFVPVEGYTSWLWVELLLACWRLLGVEPPAAASWLSLLFGYATLALVSAFVWRMRLPPRLERIRLLLLAGVLLGTVANRTFLTWLSSGLETALFNFGFTAWAYAAFARADDRGPRWVLGLSAAAAVTGLTRPDGLLIVAATLVVVAVDALQRPAVRASLWARFAQAAPLLLVAGHVLWRRWFYGEWLPNTYYAKYVEWWPEAGWRYAGSFVLEYAVWYWAAAALASLTRWRLPGANAAVATATIAAHLGYYTWVIGGDHFEYRVYSYTIPLLFVSTVWFAARLDLRPRSAVALLAGLVVMSLPVQWTHRWEAAKRVQDPFRAVPIAYLFPPGLQWYGRSFDSLQDWLLSRSIGIRQEGHALFYRGVLRMFEPRSSGSRIGWSERPVISIPSVGYVGWVLPHVAVIDRHGLNDYVIARSPPSTERERRQMAHERIDPRGYVDCFRPNVEFRRGRFRVTKRSRPLTDADIVACEQRFIAGIGRGPGNGAPSAGASTDERSSGRDASTAGP